MTETGNRRQKKGKRFSAAKIMLFASVVILAGIMPTCVVPGGISIDFVNTSSAAYTNLYLSGQAVDGTDLPGGQTFQMTGVSPGQYEITGSWSGGSISCPATVNTTDTQDTWNGPPGGGSPNGTFSN